MGKTSTSAALSLAILLSACLYSCGEGGEHIDLGTNAEEVELLVNGKSFGIKKNPAEITRRNVIYWENIPYLPGKITAIARTNGQVVAQHELETTGEAVRLIAEIENPTWKADGMDLQYIKVYAVDRKGRKVPTAGEEITIEVEGEARLIALDNGDHLSNELFAGHTKQLYKGFAMAILRSTRQAGEVRVRITSPKLKRTECKLITHE